MKFFIAFALFVSVATAASLGAGAAQPVAENILHTLTEETNISPAAAAPAELARLKKSAYGSGGASYSAPPCPKNYLFSCQPSVAPVPCAPAGHGSYAGAYSVPVPTYALPNAPHLHAIPQELLRPYHY